VADVRRLASRYLAGRAALFEARIDDGRIVDGHGDLLSEDVFCMPDRPVILDCLEFDEHLRHVDGLDDAAFLAMDLQYRGRADLATFFLHAYRQLAHDQAPASLAHFYAAYRAVVRAKVDCIRVDQGSASAAADARRHLRLGLDQLRAGTVQLVLIGGGPASGKTTLARELASRIGAVAISTDDVRHELVQSGQLAGKPGAYDAGRYDPQNVTAVYDAVLKRASGLLSNGRSVILDGTWRDPRQRQSAREVAANLHCVTVELACVLGVDQALERIRLRGLDSHSEVTEEIAKTIYQGETTWANANRIDTTAAIEHSVAAAAAVCCSAI
jgi:predicted kinase